MLTGTVVPASALGSRSTAASREVGGATVGEGVDLSPPLFAVFWDLLAAAGATGRSIATSTGGGAGSSFTGLANDAARASCHRARPDRCARTAPSASEPPATR